MSTHVRVSYKHPHELEAVLKALGPMVEQTKLQPEKGRYRLAYLYLKVQPMNVDKASGINDIACDTPGTVV